MPLPLCRARPMQSKKYRQLIRTLSEAIVHAQKPLHILDALKWAPEVKTRFLEKKGEDLPAVDAAAYAPLRFDPTAKLMEFNDIEKRITKTLGQFSEVGLIMQRLCREYREVVGMLQARGTPLFSQYSQRLYGSAEDAFYPGAPTLNDLAQLISATLASFHHSTHKPLDDEKSFTAEQAIAILSKRLKRYFKQKSDKLHVTLREDLLADAAAGAEHLSLRKDALFSKRDLRILEVHEGWVHLGTTLNGMRQPLCTFLSKGPPSATVIQEGLAIIMEIFTFSSYPQRIQRLADRITAIHMAENGADFLDVFQFFKKERGLSEEECYQRSVRVFRGSTPQGGPFTKDLGYNKGFVLIYNYIQLAIQKGLPSCIPLLFLGKTTLEDLPLWSHLLEENLIVPPKYVPPPFDDLAALSSWMCYSLFLNQLDLRRWADGHKTAL